MMFKWSVRIFICFMILVSTGQAEPNRLMQVKVLHDTPTLPTILEQMNYDIVYRGNGYTTIITDQEGLTALNSLGHQVEIEHADVTGFYKSRLDTDKTMGGYKTLSEIYAHLDSLITQHPDIMTARQSIGRTVEGRDIWVVKISDNPNIDEDEPEIMFNAAMHACEVITPEVLLNFMDYVTGNYGTDGEVTNIVDNREIWLIPVVNPDGYYYNEVIEPNGGGLWRKNRRDNLDGSFGVDLNRNFSYMWAYDDLGSSPDPSEDNYRGPEPFSEPESQAIRDFVVTHNFVVGINFHSYSEWIMFPYHYDFVYTSDQDCFQRIADSMATYNGYVAQLGRQFQPGNGLENDWLYGEQTAKSKVLEFLIEVGTEDDGFWPPLDRVDELVNENLGPMLLLCEMADNVYHIYPPEAPEVVVPETVPSVGYDVCWHSSDTLNPPVAYELMELQNPIQVVDSAMNLERWSGGRGVAFQIVEDRFHSAPSSFYSGQGTVSCLQSRDQLNVQYGDTLRFRTYYNLDRNMDYAYVELSTDGITFETIPGNITSDKDIWGVNEGNGICGRSGSWIEAVFDLSAFASQSVYIRIRYQPCYYWTIKPGIWVDDLYPSPDFEVKTIVGSDLTETCFGFFDKNPGEYYYKVRGMDAENQWSQFSVAASTYVEGDGLYGPSDVNGDGVVDRQDLRYLSDYMYNHGDPPVRPGVGDVNRDGRLDVYDLELLINIVIRNESGTATR